jgi:predicted nucleic acid-binding protein
MNGLLVLDACFTLRLLLPGPAQELYLDKVNSWQQENLILCAPALWLYEITSALNKAVYLQELTEREGREALGLALKLGVQLVPPDAELAGLAFDWTLRMNQAAAYDSFYLALAEGLECELWTADQRLANAAAVPWVHAFPEGK